MEASESQRPHQAMHESSVSASEILHESHRELFRLVCESQGPRIPVHLLKAVPLKTFYQAPAFRFAMG